MYDIEIIELLSYGFVRRALIAGSVVAIACSVLGVFLVLRRLSLIGDGLSHVAFGSIAIALLLRANPVYVSIPLVMLSSLGILRLIEKVRLHGDAAIGVVSSLGIAIGIILASLGGGFNIDLFSYLFGNILAINKTEVVISISLFTATILTISFFYYDLLSITFDEESAKAEGIKTKRINTILILLTSLTIVLAMKVVGIMLVSALLILPPVTAMQIARSFKATLVIASLTALASVIVGLFVSFILNLPAGGVIVIVNFMFFMTAFIYKKLR